jgi:hypothetical protein
MSRTHRTDLTAVEPEEAVTCAGVRYAATAYRPGGVSCRHCTACTAEAGPGDGARREHASELDYRLCCLPRTMRISRTPPWTWAAPSATKPCLR